MRTKFMEVESAEGNWGKFAVGYWDAEEWDRKSIVNLPSFSLLGQIGWERDFGQVVIFDLQTCEGAAFRPGGSPTFDLEKHRVWVCPLFEPFLEWLYDDWREYAKSVERPLIANWIDDRLPTHLKLEGVPLQMAGYRRRGPV